MKYIDTHSHYNDDEYKDNLLEILDIVKKGNVDKIINVGYDIPSSKKSIDLSKKYDYIYPAIGIHPHDVDKYDEKELIKLYEKNKDDIVAIGEIGLDYAYVKDNKEKQISMFISQINIAKKYNLPIIIHSRDASLDMYNVVKENVPAKYKLLFHCFQPSDDLVNLVIKNDYYIAVGGNITYKRNESFIKYIKMIPLDRIVIETDCPYLTPEPYRGKVNNSSYLNLVCKKLSEIKEIDEETLSKILYNNSIRFFKV